MKIELPTSALLCIWNSYGRGVNDEGRPYMAYNIISYPLSTASINIEDRLLQITSGHNTDVCHGKILDAHFAYKDNEALDFVRWYAPNAFQEPNFLIGVGIPRRYTGYDQYQNKYVTDWSYVRTSDGTVLAREVMTSYSPTRNTSSGTVNEYRLPPTLRWTYGRVTTRNRIVRRRKTISGVHGDIGPDYFLSEFLRDPGADLAMYINVARVDGLELDMDSIPLPGKFWYNEPNILTGKALWPDHIRRGFQDAFLNAYEQFPVAADNNLSNLSDMLSLCRDILTAPGKAIPKSLSELWLFWRYCLSTSSADTKQALNYLSRKMITGGRPTHYYGRSSVSGTLGGTSDIQVTVGFDVWLNVSDMPAMINYRLHQAGMELTGYTLWDFIPFSFVVDWFTPVGDRLKLQDDIRHLQQDYVFANCVFSIKYTKDMPSGKAQYYTRFYGSPPNMDDYTYYDDGYTGVATTLKRVVDIPSLVAQKFK